MKAAKRLAIAIIGLVALGLLIQYWQAALVLGAAIGILWLMWRYGQPSSRTTSARAKPKPAGRTPTVDVAAIESPVWLGVRGESHKNADGSNRQKIIAGCKEGDSVRLVREPDNPYGSTAIAVFVARGQIGYIPHEKSVIYAPLMDRGLGATAKIAKINGGTQAKPSRGVVIEVNWNFD